MNMQKQTTRRKTRKGKHKINVQKDRVGEEKKEGMPSGMQRQTRLVRGEKVLKS